jgi:hypothetical protein
MSDDFVLLSCKIFEYDWLKKNWQKIILPYHLHKSKPLSELEFMATVNNA